MSSLGTAGHIALLVGSLAVGCSTAPPTAGGPCTTRGAFDRSASTICCAGRWVFVNDLFGLPHDGGPPDGGFPDASLACEPEGASGCANGVQASCQGGVWTPTANVFCTPPPWCG